METLQNPPSIYIPLSQLIPTETWPEDLFSAFGSEGGDLLDRLFHLDYSYSDYGSRFELQLTLMIMEEIEIPLPVLGGVSIVLGASPGEAHTLVEVFLEWGDLSDYRTVVSEDEEELEDPIVVSTEKPDFRVKVDTQLFIVRFSRELLKPVLIDITTGEIVERDGYVEINMAGTLLADSDGNIDFVMAGEEGSPLEFNGPFMIGDSGVAVDVEDIAVRFSKNAPLPAWSPEDRGEGVYLRSATIFLPPEMSVNLQAVETERLIIGAGGFSGTIRGIWSPRFDATSKRYTGSGSGSLLGIPFGLRSLDLTFEQNVPSASSIQGEIVLPFFNQPLGVDIAISVDGSLAVALSAVQPEGATNQSGLVTFEKEDLLELTVESLGFEIKDDLFTTKLSGQIKPLFGDSDLEWPSFKVNDLSIDFDGNVHLDGGWLDLRDQYSLDFYGFQMEITKLGFGKTEDGGKWIGFSGGLKLVDGLSAGGSVEGLRIIWYDNDPEATKITLEGVGVEFEVPDVLRFKGAVSYREFDLLNAEGVTEKVHRFDGDIQLDLVSLDMQVDGKLVIGEIDSTKYMAIYLGVELPAGIPLFSTGLALYGMAGLFALNMEPNKGDDEEWYNIGKENSYYHRDTPGVTDLANKWDPVIGSKALGFGGTIGTLADNGFAFSGKVLFVIVFPGPILLIEGKANLLRERAKLGAEEEPVFRALAVLDGRAGTFLVGLDAQYRYDEEEGRLLDIHGGAEAFFSFSDASLWHLYLGEKEPHEKRIRAEILSLFEASTYFMLDAHQLTLGAWVGFDERWKFGPLRVALEAWIESNVAVSWKPAHFYGDLWLHGSLDLAVFGFGLGLTADALFAADVFDPFHVLAELSVGIKLPWPLPNVEADITLEWGPKPVPPPLPLPLKEIAVEHFKVTTSWPLPRGKLLLPNYDVDNSGYLHDPDTDPDDIDIAPPPALDQIPVVPLDCRPHITFGRHMNDDAMVGVNDQPGDGVWERIGDPSKDPPEGPVTVRYGLQGIALHKWNQEAGEASAWTQVARKEAPGEPDGDETVPELYGSWAPVPAMPDGGSEIVAQAKLWLWSRNPFDYTRHGGRAWDEWFTERFSDYPCVPIPDDRTFWYDFERLRPGTQLISPWAHPVEPALVFSWEDPEVRQVLNLGQQVEGRFHALPISNGIRIELPRVAKAVRFIFARLPNRVLPDGHAFSGEEFLPSPTSTQPSYPRPPVVTGTGIAEVKPRDGDVFVTGAGIRDVVVQGDGRLCLVAICSRVGLDEEERTRREEMAQHLIDELAHWGDQGNVLEPHTIYRLKVVTTIRAEGEGELDDWPDPSDNPFTQTEYAYFRTEGPPGLMNLSVPIGVPDEEQIVLRDEAGEPVQVAALDENRDPILEDGAPVLRPVFKSDLGTLTPYVRQTMPATVPATGEKPLLPRPVYRAYDVGVEFNEDYVDLLYKMARRDLGLYLYDSNNRPVRDAQGRLIVLNTRWGTMEDLILTESEERYVTVINASDCGALAQEVIRHDKTLTSAAEGQVLDPDTVYEARLIPLLFHEQFDAYPDGTSADGPSGTLGDWSVSDQGAHDGPSHWEVRGHETLRGKHATVTGAEVSLDESPDLSVLDPDFDLIILDNDTIRPDRLYRIRFVDDDAKTVSVDGEPNLEGDSSSWNIPMRGAVVQTSNTWGVLRYDGRELLQGTMLLLADNPSLPGDHPDQPGNWTDYRFSVMLRTVSPQDDAIGVVFRYHEDNASRLYYRFSMDCEHNYRRLECVLEEDEGIHLTILDEDAFVYRQDQDYLITVEAIGESLKVYQDGALVFDVTDGVLLHGGIGLYCWGNSGAHFSDVRVDDFQQGARVVYRFKFTTSQFANFFHHLHSFQDETWPGTPQPSIDTSMAVALSEFSSQPLDEETRAYEALAQAVLGSAAHTNPSKVEVTKVEPEDAGDDEDALAFLIRSPEPIDWKRTSLEVLHAGRKVPLPELPGVVKLTDVTFGTSEPNEESVTLLLREAAYLTGQRVEHRRLPGPIAEPTGDPALFVDDFEGQDSGLPYRERFEPNLRDRYDVKDEGTNLGPSEWDIQDDHIVQTSLIFGGTLLSGKPGKPQPDKPGTIAFTGSPSWANVHIRATLRSESNTAIGLVFRYQDADNYYRFSMECWPDNYRRLIKKVGGTVSVLWEWEGSTANVLWEWGGGIRPAYNRGQSYHLVIETYGDQLLGHLDDVLLFSVQDPDIRAGKVGFYCWHNSGAHFEALEVEALEAPPVLWQPALADLGEITVVDEPGAAEGPSKWTAQNGILLQSSNLHAPSDIFQLQPGTFALGGDPNWKDVEISVRLRSDDPDPIGVMFRYQDNEHYYRFSLGEHESGPFRRFYRRLIKRVGPAVAVLRQDAGPYVVGQTYELTLRAVGGELRVYLDGVPLFTVYDDELDHGRVGLYCWANPSAQFERVLVADRSRRVGRWTIHDEGTVSAPSVWLLAEGALLQTSNIYDRAPAYPGTYVVAGDPAWRDYRLAVRMRSDDDDAIGVIFRYVDDGNYYRFFVDSQRNYRQLIKKENGVVEPLPLLEDAGGYPVGEPFTLTVDAIGSRLVGYMGEDRLFDVTDDAHAAGQVGLYCWGNDRARFERVEVRHPPLEAYALFRDHFAEGDTSGWSFVDEGTEQGPANWIPLAGALCQTSNVHTLPTDRKTLDKRGTQAVAGDPAWTDVIVSARLQSPDDDAIGLLFRYADQENYYRFSMDSQRHYLRLVKNVGGTFTPLWEYDYAYKVGRPYELTIAAVGNTLRGYMDGVPMFVKEDSDLTTGCIGLYCWANQYARFSQMRVYPADQVFDDWLLDEPFDILIPGRWTFTPEGRQEGQIQWEVRKGELWQRSNIYEEAYNRLEMPEAMALAGDATWIDYRLSVRLRSDNVGAIGVVFRHTDKNNYYRFSMDGDHHGRLAKKVNGNESELWEDNVHFSWEREYILTIDCVGSQLTGYLDGVRIFSVDDDQLAAGRIGLYCWQNPVARFAEVRVAAPVWAPYYAFGREERLPAGTRVQVFAGNVTDAPAEELGVVRRFIATLDERGQLWLPANGVDLRVVATESTGGHMRQFLPESDYHVEDVQVVRKADGTGFFLLPFEVDSGLRKGQYRLKLTYRRDNQTAEPDSQVFSEGGNNADEQVVLDIPW